MITEFERMRNIAIYRTPVSLRAYSVVFLNVFPIAFGPYFATLCAKSESFPAVGYMVAVGEQSGQLEEMLDRIADSYDEEIEVVTERVTTLLEPLMIVALACVVGFIVWAIVLPILQVGNV